MLIQFDEVSLSFGDQILLKEAGFVLEPNERVCLIGRNGAGKSTLMKLIMRVLEPDSGEIRFREGLRIAQLEQGLPDTLDQTVLQIIYEGLNKLKILIEQYQSLSEQSLDATGLKALEALQRQIETQGGWDINQAVESMVTQLELPADKCLKELSGGWRRRVMLAKALVSKPDVLLLDEPTNHLDINTIEWLEHTVKSYEGTVLFVTHDRCFLQKLATRIIELDRGRLISYPCNYQRYVILKEKALEEEATQNALFDKKLEQEEVWIRQGIKARRTRNEGRVRALETMRLEYEQRVKPQGKASITVQHAERSGRKVIEACNITKVYQGQNLIKGFSLKIMRGDRIGLIGNNGVGKSTLLRILLGELEPDFGSVKLGTNLNIAYFDQMRQELELDKTVAYNVGQGKDYISINGKDRHVVGYLKNFLFTPKRAMTPVNVLSGGERNRVLLAKLFAKSSNVMILDEPTNDLDLEMLEALEEYLVDYQGTLILVSHDRHFLDNVVTSVLVFEENATVEHYAGGYSDWLGKNKKLALGEDVCSTKRKEQLAFQAQSKQVHGVKKLSYNQQRELAQLPDQIEQLEIEIKALQDKINVPTFFDQPYEKTESVLQELSKKQNELDVLTEKWLQLDALQSGTQ